MATTLAYGIHVYGSMKIDSVKVTSWNPQTNDYVESYGSRETSGKIVHVGAPRPYIRVEHQEQVLQISQTQRLHIWDMKEDGVQEHLGFIIIWLGMVA